MIKVYNLLKIIKDEEKNTALNLDCFVFIPFLMLLSFINSQESLTTTNLVSSISPYLPHVSVIDRHSSNSDGKFALCNAI